MTVSATTPSDQRLWLAPGVAANYGSCVDIWGPGTGILSASNESDTATKLRSGTSQAVPFVAGAAALYLQNSSRERPETGLACSPVCAWRDPCWCAACGQRAARTWEAFPALRGGSAVAACAPQHVSFVPVWRTLACWPSTLTGQR